MRWLSNSYTKLKRRCISRTGPSREASLRRALLQIRVEHLYKRSRVQLSSVCDHTVEGEQDRVVVLAGYGGPYRSPILR